MNALILRSTVLTKFGASFFCIDALAKHKMNFKYSDLELNLDSLFSCNLFLTIMIIDFNAKSRQWWEIDKNSFRGS